MKTRRRTMLLSVGLLLLAAGTLLLPVVRWHLIGSLRREAFYLGRPTSYWAEQTERYVPLPEERVPVLRWYETLGPSLWDRLRFIGSGGATDVTVPPLLLEANPASMPVLRELLGRDSAQARLVVVSALFDLRDLTPDAVLILRQVAADDPDEAVRRQASGAVAWIEAERAAQLADAQRS